MQERTSLEDALQGIGKVERDLAQFQPLGRWLAMPAKPVPLE